VSDIDTAVVDSLKVLDLKWPIREADIVGPACHVRKVPEANLMATIHLVGAKIWINQHRADDALASVAGP
jgi:hypothetical protein